MDKINNTLTHFPEYSWDQDPNDPMYVIFRHQDKIVLRGFLGEAIEQAGRKNIMQHVAECDRTTWLTKWQEEKHQVVIDALAQDYK